MTGLTHLEQAVLEKLLAGHHPVLDTLRAQASRCRVTSRKMTGVGFFCSLEVYPGAPLAEPSDFIINDVNGEFESLEHGAGFVLFVRDGRLGTLEGFTYDEPWPEQPGEFTLSYLDPQRPALTNLARP